MFAKSIKYVDKNNGVSQGSLIFHPSLSHTQHQPKKVTENCQTFEVLTQLITVWYTIHSLSSLLHIVTQKPTHITIIQIPTSSSHSTKVKRWMMTLYYLDKIYFHFITFYLVTLCSNVCPHTQTIFFCVSHSMCPLQLSIRAEKRPYDMSIHFFFVSSLYHYSFHSENVSVLDVIHLFIHEVRFKTFKLLWKFYCL